MKICVYTIAKNEEQFVNRFMDSAKGADSICVLDTGSTDSTVEMLKKRGAIVAIKTVVPWRFDVARNLSLELIPEDTDVCVCVDLDEVLCDGWRESIEQAWTEKTTCGRHRLVWSHDAVGNAGGEYMGERVHKYGVYKWENAAHNILVPLSDSVQTYIPDFRIDHYPDTTKQRPDYISMLKLDVVEKPNSTRAAHYLGREYMYKGMYQKAITTLKSGLLLCGSSWKAERATSMRYIAKCYENSGDKDLALAWFYRACAECKIREPLVDMALFLYRAGNRAGTAYFASEALKITDKLSYISYPEAWGATPHDLLSVASWYLGDKKKSLVHAQLACELNPQDERLKKNLELVKGGQNG